MAAETEPEPGLILIFHEDPRLLDELTGMLPMYHISKTSRVDEAERMLKNRAFDFFILNGIATNKLLDLAQAKGTPALVLTSDASPADPTEPYLYKAVPRLPTKAIATVPLIVAKMLSVAHEERNTKPRWLGRITLFSENGRRTRKQQKDSAFWDAYKFLRLRCHE